MKRGWVRIYRKLQSHWLWDDKPFSKGQAWIDLILLATHDDKSFLLGNELIEVKAGGFVTSELKLMERWGWGKAKTRAFLNLLQKDGMITKISDRKKTTIIIENYSLYALCETTEEPQVDHEQTTNRPQTDTNNNINNIKHKNNKDTNIVQKEADKLFENLWKQYPNKKGKGQVSDSKKREIFKVGYDEMCRALQRYQEELKKDSDWRKPQNGSTFFNSGYVDYLDANYQPSGNTYQQRKDDVDLSGIL